MRLSVLALLLLFAVSACKSADAPSEAAPAKAPADLETKPGPDGKLRIEATEEGFSPSRVVVPGGVPVTLTFVRTAEETCMTGVHFPELGIEKELPLGTPVDIEVTAPRGGELTFQCPMAMGKSAVIGLP